VSRVVTTRIAPGDARDPAIVNAWYTAVQTAGNAIDATNIADEGVSRHVTQAMQKAALVERITETTRAGASLAATGWTTLVFSGETFRTAALSVGPGEVLDIRARLEFTSTRSSGIGFSVDDEVGIRLAVSSLGIVSAKEGTRRDHVALVDRDRHARLSTRGFVFGPALNLDFVELQYRIVDNGGAGVTARPHRAILDVVRYRRVTAP
jgi:hypothetical protein